MRQYDPSLALGNIVPEDHLTVLEEISKLQTPIDSALDELNSAILLKRKLQMTMQDLLNLHIDTIDVTKQCVLGSSAVGYQHEYLTDALEFSIDDLIGLQIL